MVHIVTDSNSGITPEMAQQLGISGVAATYVLFGDKSYKDSVELKAEQFYDMLASAPALPTTSAPSVGDFEDIFKTLKGQEVLALIISRDLSATIKACENAAEMMEGDPKVTIIDTRYINVGESLLVLEALDMAKAGKSAAEIKARVESLIPRIRLYIALETLENLKRGGRITNTAAFIGNLLQMRPILTVKDGKVAPHERVRTASKALARVKEIALADLQGQTNPKVMFLHASNLAAANALKEDFKQIFKFDYEPMVLEAGPAVGTHVGAGAVGLAYFV